MCMKNDVEVRKIPDDPLPDARSEEFKAAVHDEYKTSEEPEKSSQNGLKQAVGGRK